jgi:hypothetical protein
MSVRPTRFSAALLVLPAVLAMTGCAGTAPSPAAGTGTSAASTPPSDNAPRTGEGRRIEVSVAGGKVRGETGRVPVDAGTAVTLVVTSDVADEVHVHGYDVAAELTPNTPAELSFDATAPGVFEVELHEAGTVLLTLQVS